MGMMWGAIAGGLTGMATGAISAQQEFGNRRAAYQANKIEVERNNFIGQLTTERKNFFAAKSNAMRKWNNQKIAEAALTNYAVARAQLNEQFRNNSKMLGANLISQREKLHGEITGKNLQGGTADRMRQVQQQRAFEARMQNHTTRWEQARQAGNQYNNALNQRDLWSYEVADLFIPGSVGQKPRGWKMNLMTTMLSEGIAGANAGASIGGAMGG
jgi:hypothetical protein